MHGVIMALAFSSALTSIFAFRFRPSRRGLLLYFALFLGVETLAQTFFLPEDAMPPAAAAVLFGIAALFVPLSALRRRLDAKEAEPRDDPRSQ